MTNKQIEELSFELTAYTIKLGRSPTPFEYEKFIKTFITCSRKGKLLSAHIS